MRCIACSKSWASRVSRATDPARALRGRARARQKSRAWPIFPPSKSGTRLAEVRGELSSPMNTRPQIKFCSVGAGTRIAFAVQGAGPVVVLGPSHVSDLERDVDEPALRHFYDRLATHFTLVRYDHTGAGLSDRTRREFSLEREVLELKAVIEQVTEDPVVLLGGSFGGPVATAFAALHPQRVSRLILYGSFADGTQLAPPDVKRAIVELVRAHWRLGARTLTTIIA